MSDAEVKTDVAAEAPSAEELKGQKRAAEVSFSSYFDLSARVTVGAYIHTRQYNVQPVKKAFGRPKFGCKQPLDPFKHSAVDVPVREFKFQFIDSFLIFYYTMTVLRLNYWIPAEFRHFHAHHLPLWLGKNLRPLSQPKNFRRSDYLHLFVERMIVSCM